MDTKRMFIWLAEETPATENDEASDEVKEPQSESKETSSSENEGNAKDEAPAAVIEASSEQPRGLGLCVYLLAQYCVVDIIPAANIYLYCFRFISK